MSMNARRSKYVEVWGLSVQGERAQWDGTQLVLALGDLDELVDRDFTESLRDASCRPVDFDHLDLLGLTQSEVLAQRVGAEAPAAVDPSVDAARPSLLHNVHSNARSNR